MISGKLNYIKLNHLRSIIKNLTAFNKVKKLPRHLIQSSSISMTGSSPRKSQLLHIDLYQVTCNYDCHIDGIDCRKYKSASFLLFINMWMLFHYSLFEYRATHGWSITSISVELRERLAIISIARCVSAQIPLFYFFLQNPPPPSAFNRLLFFYGVSPSGYFSIRYPATRYWLY